MTPARDTAAEDRPLAAHPSTGMPLPHLTMQGIVKRYGALTALDRVDLTVGAGEIHALLGENGAGKSTLMQVLAGLTHPDAGVISLAGQQARIVSPRIARRLGIAMVHQHFTLVPAFTVAENLALDTQRSDRVGRRAIGYAAMEAAAPALQRATDLGWRLQPDARVADLSVGAQQRIEIIKALSTEARLLIFDEPTAVLASDEIVELFHVLRRLRDEGRTVILIAHKLAEIMAVADRVTVLRRGRVVATTRVSDTNPAQLAAWMIGEEGVGRQAGGESVPEQARTSQPPTPNADRLRPAFSANQLMVRGDRGDMAVRGVSFAMAAGEIFGIGGVDGNGQTELAEALVGLRPPDSGEIRWQDGPFVAGSAPRLGYIPQDRRRAGLAVTMSIEDNLLWDALHDPRYRRGPFVNRRELHRLAESLREQFDIRALNLALPASALSGGNQQKIVVARAFYPQPDWIVAVNPTRGLDIGATRFVHEQLLKARGRGAAITLISTDLDELAALADRTAILSGGQLTEYVASEIDSAQIGLLLGGMSASTSQEGTAS